MRGQIWRAQSGKQGVNILPGEERRAALPLKPFFIGTHALDQTDTDFSDAAHPVARHVLAPSQNNRAFDIVEKKLLTDGVTGMARLNRPAYRHKGYEGIGLKVFPS